METLELKNIKKSFKKKEILHGIDLQIKSSEVFGLLGPNGAGKTTFVGMEKIDLYGKIYDADRFSLKSKDMSIPKDKRLDFDIWYDRKNLMILKVSYSRMGNWEYRLKNFD